MFGELPKLFGRDFAIGYLLPVTAFVTVSVGLLQMFGLANDLLQLLGSELLVGAVAMILVSWLGGVFLLTANRDLVRLLEGYGRFNPAQLYWNVEKKRYRALSQAIAQLEQQAEDYYDNQEAFPLELQNELDQRMEKMSERFPDQERLVMPTPFGNTIAAFEVYSRVMYGFDAVPGWLRLLAVIPENFRQLIDSAKAFVDFWVNLWILNLAVTIEYLALLAYTRQLKYEWFLLIAVITALIAAWRAQVAAAQWGGYVKSACDVFLPELGRKLGFSIPLAREDQILLWQQFSAALIYRQPLFLPNSDNLPGADQVPSSPHCAPANENQMERIRDRGVEEAPVRWPAQK